MSDQKIFKQTWRIFSLLPANSVPQDFLSPQEQLLVAFKTVRDLILLTDKRWIFQDSQGVTGVKKEITSVPLTSILMWTMDFPGPLNADGSLTLYTPIGDLVITIARGIDFQQLNQTLSRAILL